VSVLPADAEAELTASSSLLAPPARAPCGAAAKDLAREYGTHRGRRVLASIFTASATGSAAPVRKGVSLDPLWVEMPERIASLAPYFWPSKSTALQSHAVRPFRS
jgi:hypothetical protein